MRYSQEILDLFKTKEVQERFWSKVDKSSTDGCWKWQASSFKYGYGKFRISNSDYGAHILSLWSYSNEAPEGRFCLHKCDNPSCLNPSHLWYGTQSDNMRDASNKGRLNSGANKGKKNGMSKITEDQALSILKAIREIGRDSKAIQRLFPDISLYIIQNILHNKTWKYLPR